MHTLKFKEWLKEWFSQEPPGTGGDPARRPDLIKGDAEDCHTLPMGVRGMCQNGTSAFPTYKLPPRQKKMRKR